MSLTQTDPLEDAAALRLTLLTEKEREALRLVQSHGTIHEIAKAIGISEAATKLRLNSASRKLGVRGRHAAARLLLASEQPYPNRHMPIGQVAGTEPFPFAEPAGRAVGSSLREARMAYDADELTSARGLLRRLLLEPGVRHDLTNAQRLRWMALYCVAGLLLLCVVGAVLSELSRTASALLPHSRI